MDQDAWNQVYSDLENDVAAMTKRGGDRTDPTVFLLIDRARFAIDKGDNAAAIAIIQDLRQRLSQSAGGDAATRGVAAIPSIDRMNALEDMLHGEKRFGSARLEIVGEEEEPTTRAASQNAKVDRSIKYDDIKDEYVALWEAARIRDDKRDAVRAEANRVIANREIYEQIEADTRVPWWFTGLIHGMECSFSLNKHLHNGDSLKGRTWQVPAGRPKTGSPPFTFEQSACDALECDGFAGKTDWPLPMVLYRLERYNGFGYRKKFGTASPYLWSYTNHFTSGKYVKDGVYDPDATSKQCGAAAMLRDLMERGVVVFEATPEELKPAEPKPADVVGAAPAVVLAPAPAPTVAPAAAPPTVAPAAVPGPGSTPGSTPAPQPAAAPSQPAASPAPTPGSTPVAPVGAPAAVPVGAGTTPAAPATPLPAGISPAVAAALSALAAATKPGVAAEGGKPADVGDKTAEASRARRR